MRVLFVSKPVAPPFHDGTKCLVRDIALGLKRVTPVVMSSRGAPALGNNGSVELVRVYGNSGDFTPVLAQNLRAAAWVLLRSRADVWHFVFAPNPRTSRVGALLRRARGVPVVQTIASPPRSFDDIGGLLFGDVVVAQSHWTRDRVLSAYASSGLSAPPIRVIPPPVPLDLRRSAEQVAAVRAGLSIPEGAPLFVYPGDLEVSSGARVTAELSQRIAAAIPGAITVFAYRKKTEQAAEIAARLQAELNPATTRIVDSLPDVLALIAGATAVLFPVDDLWGKVDLPIVLLEAMVLGVPVVVLEHGPLADLESAVLVPTLDPEAWMAKLTELTRAPEYRSAQCERQKAAVAERHAAARVARSYEDLYLEFGLKRPVQAGAGEVHP